LILDLGIPYAAPPVGDRRWKEPTPAENWHGVKNATNWGQLCTQTVNQDSKKVIGSEDCLFLNIFTSNKGVFIFSKFIFKHLIQLEQRQF